MFSQLRRLLFSWLWSYLRQNSAGSSSHGFGICPWYRLNFTDTFFSLKKNENLKMTLISQDYMGHFCWMVFKPPLEPAWHHLPRLHSGKHCYTVEETAKGMTRRLWEAIPISLLCQFVLPLKPKYSPNPPSLPAQLFYPPQSPRGPIPKTYFHLNFT